jgi:hypothetical protein
VLIKSNEEEGNFAFSQSLITIVGETASPIRPHAEVRFLNLFSNTNIGGILRRICVKMVV